MKKSTVIGYSIITALLVAALFQLLLCVPVNLHSGAFVFELMIVIGIVWFGLLFAKGKLNKNARGFLVWSYPVLFVLVMLYCLIGTPYTGGLHNYKDQAKVSETAFETIPEFDASQVQLVDKNTAIQLGDRVFGTLGSDEVSQYAVGDDWVQIAVNNKLYRVTPIDFGGLFKYLITRTTPGYILVDCQNGDASLVRNEGLKYMTSAYFFDDLKRHLFLKDPFAIYGEARFELDDQMDPVWVVPVLQKTWLEKTTDVKGVYVVSPYDGSATYYDKGSVPAWVDNVYPVSVLYRQFAQSKRYENGLFNWSKKGVVEYTDDYAYVMFDDHVWIYTGVTSVGKDESNVGFAYIDLRSGEVRYIRRAGAEEYSARSSAEGAVQQYHYTAIFPSMVNVKGTPTYFMGLVDSANLIKNYAFVNYENYQLVASAATVEDAYDKYVRLVTGGVIDHGDTSEKTLTVSEVNQTVLDGNTVILILDSQGQIYRYDLANGDLQAAFIKAGDRISVLVSENGRIVEFKGISHPQQ